MWFCGSCVWWVLSSLWAFHSISMIVCFLLVQQKLELFLASVGGDFLKIVFSGSVFVWTQRMLMWNWWSLCLSLLRLKAFITFLCLYVMVWYAENYGPREKVSHGFVIIYSHSPLSPKKQKGTQPKHNVTKGCQTSKRTKKITLKYLRGVHVHTHTFKLMLLKG